MKRRKTLGYAMMAPTLLLILIMQIYPLARGIWYSFENYQITRPGVNRFVGLKNYIDLLTTDEKFYRILGFTMVYTIVVCVAAYVIGLALALLLNRNIPGRGVIRAFILLPWIISGTVCATNWRWILNDRYGIINLFLQKIGLISQPLQFLGDMQLARFTVILIGIWKFTPFMVVVLLAGLQSVNNDLYEAAKIDGAGFWRCLFSVTLPSIRSVTTMSTTLLFIWAFNNFESTYLLTGGGPNDATFTLPIYIYQTSFYRGKISYGSAVAISVLLIVLLVSILRITLQRKEDE